MQRTYRIVTPGLGLTLVGEQGEILIPPDHWAFLPAGDAGITRKVTTQGIFWRLQVRRGRRLISKGLWAPRETITRAQQEMQVLRKTEGYQKKLASSQKYRAQKQQDYVEDFFLAVRKYLAFAALYQELESKIARAVTLHTTPVSSKTVARTIRIPLAERASRATIAWMRHATTAYDTLKIPPGKGRRREVRRMLAAESINILGVYRRGETPRTDCPLRKLLPKPE